MTTKDKIRDLEADCVCMGKVIKAFEELSRHHCEINSPDSVAISQATSARSRVLQWVNHYITDHPYL